MRRIDEIIIHCSATKEGKDFRAADIDKWHRAQDYKCIGYHYVIDLDGTIEEGRPESEKGAHAGGDHNPHSIGICYIGGLTAVDGYYADTRTEEQKRSLILLLQDLKNRYPNAKILGHRDISAKACPCFDAAREYGDIRPHSLDTASSADSSAATTPATTPADAPATTADVAADRVEATIDAVDAAVDVAANVTRGKARVWLLIASAALDLARGLWRGLRHHKR